MTKLAIVYSITNTKTGTKYIGKTINPETRWDRHKKDAERGVKTHLYNSMRKYEISSFLFEIIKEFEKESDAFDFEEKHITELLQSGAKLYNVAPGGLGGFGGTQSSKEGLVKFYANHENRKNVSEKVNASYLRKDVRTRVAKKLTEEIVLEIREKYDNIDEIDFHQVGEIYNVSAETIWQVLRRKTWKHAGK